MLTFVYYHCEEDAPRFLTRKQKLYRSLILLSIESLRMFSAKSYEVVVITNSHKLCQFVGLTFPNVVFCLNDKLTVSMHDRMRAQVEYLSMKEGESPTIFIDTDMFLISEKLNDVLTRYSNESFILLTYRNSCNPRGHFINGGLYAVNGRESFAFMQLALEKYDNLCSDSKKWWGDQEVFADGLADLSVPMSILRDEVTTLPHELYGNIILLNETVYNASWSTFSSIFPLISTASVVHLKSWRKQFYPIIIYCTHSRSLVRFRDYVFASSFHIIRDLLITFRQLVSSCINNSK